MVTIKIAGLNVALDNKYEFTARFVSEFITDEAPDFTVSASESELKEESVMAGDASIPPERTEHVVLYRKIANVLPKYNGAVFHGSVIQDGDKAYIITARSGVGKTTHSRLWLSEFGDSVRILNGDKPIIRLVDGKVMVYGTPWRGKEGYGVNGECELCAVGFLLRDENNSARIISPGEAVTQFVSQTYLDRSDTASLIATMRTADEILRRVVLVELRCNMDAEAAKMAKAAFNEAINKFKYNS